MSGGHFNYNCFRISDFADELQHEIATNGDETEDGFGCPCGSLYDEKTIANLKAAHAIIEKAGELAREVEWLYSGDHGEDSFNKLMDEKLPKIEIRYDYKKEECIIKINGKEFRYKRFTPVWHEHIQSACALFNEGFKKIYGEGST